MCTGFLCSTVAHVGWFPKAQSAPASDLHKRSYAFGFTVSVSFSLLCSSFLFSWMAPCLRGRSLVCALETSPSRRRHPVSPLLIQASLVPEMPPVLPAEPGCSSSPRLQSPLSWGWSSFLGGLWASLELPAHLLVPGAKDATSQDSP